jgi:arabinofuranan 3-O-arabinosyltransferase
MYVGRPLEYLKITYGWSLLMIVVFTVLYFRYLDAKAGNRLDDGIDPVWAQRVTAIGASVEA